MPNLDDFDPHEGMGVIVWLVVALAVAAVGVLVVAWWRLGAMK